MGFEKEKVIFEKKRTSELFGKVLPNIRKNLGPLDIPDIQNSSGSDMKSHVGQSARNEF